MVGQLLILIKLTHDEVDDLYNLKHSIITYNVLSALFCIKKYIMDTKQTMSDMIV